MVDDPHGALPPPRVRLPYKQRMVMKAFKVGMSEDGLRWTAPHRHHEIVEKAFHRAALLWWQEGSEANVMRTDEGLVFDCPRGRMELRWLD